MSGFYVNGVYICNNYQPLNYGLLSNTTTNFMVNGKDLNTIFMAYQNGTQYYVPYATSAGGKDTNFEKIFQHKVYVNDISYTQTGGTHSTGTINNTPYNDIITFNSSGTFTFEVLENIDNQPVSFLAVGPGGDGSSSEEIYSQWVYGNYYRYGGNGGGGGEVIVSSFKDLGEYEIRLNTGKPTEIVKDTLQIVAARAGNNNGLSGSGNEPGTVNGTVPGTGGGGDVASGNGSTGGVGTSFNETTYGSGGDGGGYDWSTGESGLANTGNGGDGGGLTNSHKSYEGGSGGTGICILYFNPS